VRQEQLRSLINYPPRKRNVKEIRMADVKILAIIKARMRSKRLPGKSLKKVAGKPLLEYTIDRLSTVDSIDKIVVATSKEKIDDSIASFCKEKGVDFFRGSEEDVLSRFAQAARRYNPEYIVRICGDEPLVDPKIVKRAIKEHIQQKADYTTTVGNFPTGVDVEVINYDVLRDVDGKVKGRDYRENETMYIRDNPDKYRIHRMKPPKKLNRPDIVVTVDTKEDLKFVESILKNSRTGSPDTEEVVSLVDSGKVSRKPQILIRADGSKEKGLGDLTSSMNIARQMEDKYQFVFASKNYEQGIDFVKSQGYDVLVLPIDNGEREDLRIMKEYCDRHGIGFCIVQLVPNNPSFVKKLSKFVKTLMVDFDGGIEVASDILLCWDLDANKKNYKFSRPDTVSLLGPKYAPLKKDVIRYRKEGYGSKIERVAVTTGGSDPHNITFKLLGALERLDKAHRFNFILGPGFERFDEFKDKASERFGHVRNPENPHEIFSESDLVISTGGLTCFELAALGAPFIGISNVPHEARRLKKLDSLGVCKFVSMGGDLGGKIARALESLSSKETREKMGERGKSLVDGRGAGRVAAEVGKLLGGLHEDRR